MPGLTTNTTNRFDEDGAHTLLVGGGPRSVIQVNAEVAFMMLHRSHFDQLASLGAQYDIRTTVVESRDALGVGAAFSREHAGMMNSGVEQNIAFPKMQGSSHSQAALDILSYRKRYENKFGQDKHSYYEELKSANLPGAVMFKRSIGSDSFSPAGELDQSTPYLLRRTVGEEEQEHFKKVLQIAKEDLPFYNLDVLRNTTVESLRIDSAKPTAFVRSNGSIKVDCIQADCIRMNTGTTASCPVKDPVIQKQTFSQPMNGDDLRSFFAKRDMLDEDGMLRPGTRVISGGLGLSGIDQVSALDQVMGLFEEDDASPVGFRVSELAKQKYQDSIAFVSRSGAPCQPKHSSSPEWQQGISVLGSTKNMHALYLHKHGEEIFRTWFDIVKAAVARASNLTPDQVIPSRKNSKQLIKFQFFESLKHLDALSKAGSEEQNGDMDKKNELLELSTRTLYGAWRQAALGTLFGFGLESDLRSGQSSMSDFAPATWKGRQGWFHRSQTRSISLPSFVQEESNVELFKNFEVFMSHVTSSPVQMHSVYHLLLEAGIARVVAAPYSEIKGRAEGQGLTLAGEAFDAFVVSPTFQRSEDVAAQSLTGQVEPIVDSNPSFGKVGKHRRFVRKDGEAVAVEESGLGGKGFRIKTGDRKGSILGAFACDLNNRASSTSAAAGTTIRRMALSHLKAAGIENASKVLDDIYERQKPSVNAYESEVRKFEEHFHAAYDMWAFLKAIEIAAGKDATLFSKLYDAGLSEEGRADMMSQMEESVEIAHQNAAAEYRKYLEDAPAFEPQSRDEYFNRFVDTTPQEDVSAYEEALRMATEHLRM